MICGEYLPFCAADSNKYIGCIHPFVQSFSFFFSDVVGNYHQKNNRIFLTNLKNGVVGVEKANPVSYLLFRNFKTQNYPF